MIIYDISFINSYYNSIEHEKIDSSIQTLLDSILETVNIDCLINNYDVESDSKFKKKNKFKKYENSNNTSKENFFLSRTLKNMYISTKKKTTIDKSKLDNTKSNIKIILNKLSPSNYSKLETEFITIYSDLIDNNDEETIEVLKIIDNYIIEHICYNNLSYSVIYVNLLFTLINMYYVKGYKFENIVIYNLLKEKYNDILKLENYIKNNIHEDEYTINKNNDKYKCFIIFIINYNKKIYYYELENIEKNVYIKELFINCFVIEEFVMLLNNFFINNLKIENNSTYCEIILEFLIIIYNELFKETTIMKKIDHELNLYNTIKTILSNNYGYANYTNKIKFKLMDIEDKYKKYIL